MSLVGFLCGVPDEFCCGGHLNTDQNLQHRRYHTDRKQAFNCYKKYLVRVRGYTQVGTHEFAPADGGPVLVISRVSQFGGELRKGKHGQGEKATRKMPKKRNRGLVY